MEFVMPIKDVNHIRKIKAYLKKRSFRDYLLFVFEINTGLRINELLAIKVEQVWDGETPREFIESTSDKTSSIYLNTKIRSAIKQYMLQSTLSSEDYLFITKNGTSPITRQQAYRIINKAAREIGIHDKIGIHTLRKTFGYHAYKKGIAISLIRDIYGHSSTSETLHYIGIDKKESTTIKVDVNL
ncbi:tyrosine-type recombinase/integrase [Gracilibacillus thailandensis]|uniref:Tyrosine-type recombinase/integrase n=1 Tax=Gracilibacillus thailandensis TaxID=563735 RepID=A0A6N7QXG2_9BACI|nr:tyrosine-type recombinase/integrase [Gracilibacillus thailandensis]MRI66823.1 tyrosine-type recombinase/integrase [Gracilibacillus thailandensis]